MCNICLVCSPEEQYFKLVDELEEKATQEAPLREDKANIQATNQ